VSPYSFRTAKEHYAALRAQSQAKGGPTVYASVQQNFPVKGFTTALPPGTTFEYTVPDFYGRPWAQAWEKYHEQGMLVRHRTARECCQPEIHRRLPPLRGDRSA